VEIQPLDFNLSTRSLETLLGFFHSENPQRAQKLVKPTRNGNKLKVVIDQPACTFSTSIKDAEASRDLSLVIDASQIFFINEPLDMAVQRDVTGNNTL
jgi:hypothetical protein